jgi:hypothetical protein
MCVDPAGPKVGASVRLGLWAHAGRAKFPDRLSHNGEMKK